MGDALALLLAIGLPLEAAVIAVLTAIVALEEWKDSRR